MTHVPPDTYVTVAVVVLPESVPEPTVQTPVVSDVKTINKLEVVLAVIDLVFVDLRASVGFTKVIV
jgi:hypothetical protein